MNEALRMTGVLTAFCVVSGALLAWTDAATKGPIEAARRAELADALKKVLPECDNDVMADAKVVQDGGREWTFYVARRSGEFVGAAFKGSADGYGGPIEVLAGVLPDGTIKDVKVLLADKETPGLGSKVSDPAFLKQFTARGQGGGDTRWVAVTKDGGEIQAITGATISSRALTRAIKADLDVYARHRDRIREDR
jgi:electron transport complex protein RnfG